MKNGKKDIKDEVTICAGFTFLEVLVAMLLISVGLFGMASVSNLTGTMTSQARQATTATIIAQEKLEELCRTGYSGLPDLGIITTEDYNSMSQHPTFRRAASTLMTDAANGIKVVAVTVYWNQDRRSMALKTVVSKK